MSLTIATRQKLFGLLELDVEGRVLYSRIDSGTDARNFEGDIRGLNFFTEVAPFENTGELQQHVDDFRLGSQQANTISFTCQYGDGPVQVRVLMARIRERSENDHTKSILVHIRKIGE